MVDSAIRLSDLERCIALITIWFSSIGDNAKESQLMMDEVSALYPDLPMNVFIAAIVGAYARINKLEG